MRILIIEDEQKIATNLYDFLEARGHTVDAAADGVTGLHLAVSVDFDAIVLDLRLPGIDGLEVCRKLREDAQRDTPVLMLTARGCARRQVERVLRRRRRLFGQAVLATGSGSAAREYGQAAARSGRGTRVASGRP